MARFTSRTGFLAPDKIDNKFFDPKHAFKEVEVQAKTVKELIPVKKAKVCVGGGGECGILL